MSTATLMGKCKPKTGQPFHISSRKLRLIKAPTLVILGGKADSSAARPLQRSARGASPPDCDIEILPSAGHIMSVDEPEFVGERIVDFLEAEKG
jgi:pimeloyl-ACP methyl ester carboxylesterase